jgi:hypothetical protein
MGKPGHGDANARIDEVRGDEILGEDLQPVAEAQPEGLSEEQAGVAADAVVDGVHTPEAGVLRSGGVLHAVEVRASGVGRLFLEILQVGEELREREVGVDPVVQQVVAGPERAAGGGRRGDVGLPHAEDASRQKRAQGLVQEALVLRDEVLAQVGN